MKTVHILRLALATSLCVLPPHEEVSAADNASAVASWRGPAGNGSYPAQQQYPRNWSENENILWRTTLPGRGASTPIVIDNQLFITAADEESNWIASVDPVSGKLLWSRPYGTAAGVKNQKASAANSSPVSDGNFVYAYFKSGDVICSTMNGEVRWEINLQEMYGEDTLWWDLGTSPVLTDKALIIAIMHSGPSYIVAIDKLNGKELWRADRSLDVNEESNQAYTTPVVYQRGNQTLVLTLGADHLTAHDASDGSEVFRVGGFNPTNHQYFRSIASPVVVGDLVICPYARGETLTAVRLADDLPEDQRVAWTRDDLGADVPTPTVVGDKLLVLGDKGNLWCLNPADGSTVWETQLPKHRKAYSSSPVAAGGLIYCTREDATTFVVDATDGKVIAENSIDGETVATAMLHDSRLYLRTYDSLYCIGGGQPAAQ